MRSGHVVPDSVDDEMAALLARSLELEVSHPSDSRRAGIRWQRVGRNRPVLRRCEVHPVFGNGSAAGRHDRRPLGAPIPVALVTRDWKTGQAVDRIPFSVRPNYATTFRQLERFGRRQAVWVRALWTLGIAFVVVESIALWLAIRVTRRIVGAVDRLSHAAAEIGQGNLSYRIPVERDDQLGRLSLTFNHMAESVKERMQETREKEQFRQELLVARQVQESLNPEDDAGSRFGGCVPTGAQRQRRSL